MAPVIAGLMGATLWGTSITSSSGDPGSTPGDEFDVITGTVMNSNSPVMSGCLVTDILGSAAGTPTPGGCEAAGQVVFSDTNTSPWPFGTPPAAPATDYYLTFTTASPIDLAWYQLYLADDNADGDPNRTVSRFRLFLDDGSGTPVQLLSDVTILNPGDVNYRAMYGASDILVGDSFADVTGSQFSAVFTSNSLVSGAGQGPRVFELDGFSSSDVPEPGSLLLIGVGATVLWLRRKVATH